MFKRRSGFQFWEQFESDAGDSVKVRAHYVSAADEVHASVDSVFTGRFLLRFPPDRGLGHVLGNFFRPNFFARIWTTGLSGCFAPCVNQVLISSFEISGEKKKRKDEKRNSGKKLKERRRSFSSRFPNEC